MILARNTQPLIGNFEKTRAVQSGLNGLPQRLVVIGLLAHPHARHPDDRGGLFEELQVGHALNLRNQIDVQRIEDIDLARSKSSKMRAGICSKVDIANAIQIDFLAPIVSGVALLELGELTDADLAQSPGTRTDRISHPASA